MCYVSVWAFFLICFQNVSAAPLAVKLAGAFGNALEEQVSKLEELTPKVAPFSSKRNFGYDGTGQGVLYIHERAETIAPDVLPKMLELARQADKEAGWHALDGAELSVRCMELLYYKPIAGDSIGMHVDGATIITLAAMLTDQSEYTGGDVFFKRLHPVRQKELYNLSHGDVLAWRGSHVHGVRPVESGERKVFVVEFWKGRDVRANDLSADHSHRMRMPDETSDLRRAAELDPDCWDTFYSLGQSLCMRLPCRNATVADEAEVAYRKAMHIRTYVTAPNPSKAWLRFVVKYFPWWKWCIWSESFHLHDSEHVLMLDLSTLRAAAKVHPFIMLGVMMGSVCPGVICVFLCFGSLYGWGSAYGAAKKDA